MSNVKIDRSFIRDIPGDKDDVALVRTIIAMARSLNLCGIAEGVEHAYQCDFLKEEGCEEYQGFAIAKPISAQEVLALSEKTQIAGVRHSLTPDILAEVSPPTT